MKKTLLIPAALFALTFTACRNTTPAEEAAHSDNTAVVVPNGEPTAGDLVDSAGNKIDRAADATAATVDNWTDVDWNGPVVKDWNEVNDKDIEVRGTDRYGIYTLSEDVLFAKGSKDLSAAAQAKVKAIAASINQRFNGADVRISGFTDATGNAIDNQELSKQRAESVRAALMNDGRKAEKVTVKGMGETATTGAAGRKVQIVARKA